MADPRKTSAIVISKHNAETKCLNTITFVVVMFGKFLIKTALFHLVEQRTGLVQDATVGTLTIKY